MHLLNKYSAISEVNGSGYPDGTYYSVRFSDTKDCYFDYDDEYIYLPIHTIEEDSYCGPVYNFEVKDDNSYNIGVAVHNCELYYNDQEMERRKLAEKGIKVKDIKDPIKKARMSKQRHLTVLCKNMNGYRNLLSIKKQSYDYFYNKPRTNIGLINKFKDDIIVLSGCMNGPISFEIKSFIETEDEIYWEKALKTGKIFKKVVGEDFYVELQMPGVEGDVELFYYLNELAKELKIKTVLTNDAHYIKEKDYNIQRIMMSIDQNLPFNSDGLFISESTSGYLKTREELKYTFENGHVVRNETLPPYNEKVSNKDFEIACNNTLEIADKCEDFKPDMSTKLPIIESRI